MPKTLRLIPLSVEVVVSRYQGEKKIRLSVEDTSVYTSIQDTTTPTVEQMPVFRTFRSTNTLVLRDGQMREFTAAVDRVSGEMVRIGVTLRVVK